MDERDKNNLDDFVDQNENQIDDREEATLGMSEIDNFDFERAVQLMSVMEKVANVAPKATAISGLAGAALEEMNEEAKAIAKRRAEEFEKLAAQRAEALAAQQREREEQEARDAEQAAQVNVHPKPPIAPERQPIVQPRAIPSRAPTPPTDNARRV